MSATLSAGESMYKKMDGWRIFTINTFRFVGSGRPATSQYRK